MCRRRSGFHEPECRRRAPREIGASAAAPEPPGRAPQSVFRDHSEPAGTWQSGDTANGSMFWLAHGQALACMSTSALGGG